MLLIHSTYRFSNRFRHLRKVVQIFMVHTTQYLYLPFRISITQLEIMRIRNSLTIKIQAWNLNPTPTQNKSYEILIITKMSWGKASREDLSEFKVILPLHILFNGGASSSLETTTLFLPRVRVWLQPSCPIAILPLARCKLPQKVSKKKKLFFAEICNTQKPITIYQSLSLRMKTIRG